LISRALTAIVVTAATVVTLILAVAAIASSNAMATARRICYELAGGVAAGGAGGVTEIAATLATRALDKA